MGRRISSLQDANVGIVSEIGSKYSNVKAVADNISSVNTIVGSFDILLKYLGPGEVPPTSRLDGQPLENGDYYFHKTDTEEAILYYDISEDSWYPGNAATVDPYDDSDVLKDSDTLSPVTSENKIITESDVTGGGDMVKAVYDSNNNGTVDNAEKVNSLTVETAVPSGAVFTDTTYTNVSEFTNDAGYLTSGAEGDSAYAVAVTNGFVGDETAWLASLVGTAGIDGSDGVNGINMPTEVVTVIPESPTEGTLYIVIPS